MQNILLFTYLMRPSIQSPTIKKVLQKSAKPFHLKYQSFYDEFSSKENFFEVNRQGIIFCLCCAYNIYVDTVHIVFVKVILVHFRCCQRNRWLGFPHTSGRTSFDVHRNGIDLFIFDVFHRFWFYDNFHISSLFCYNLRTIVNFRVEISPLFG